MFYSYVMGIGDAVLQLVPRGFCVERDGENFTVAFPKEKAHEWESFIRSHLEFEYWNEYITHDRAVFLFHLQDGIKRFEVQGFENDEVLALCERLCGCKFGSVVKMLSDNHFYHHTVFGTGKELIMNPLYQKSVLFVGDSLCEAYCERESEQYKTQMGWAGRIMTANSMTGINKSLGGASIGNCRGENLVYNQLIAMTGNTYDYLIIEGGANDAWDNAPVGVMTEGFDGPFDRDSFAGGLEATFAYAKEHFASSKLGFIVTFQMPSAQFGRMSDMSEYFALSKQICDKWGIPYLDLYFDEDFNKNVLKSATNENLPDFIHPNSSGYNILSPIIENWMKTL